MKFFNLFKKAIYSLPPETAHNFAIFLLNYNLIPRKKIFIHKILKTSLANIDFPTPVGLAAGFDKNASAINNLSKLNFGFIETGTVTPQPQIGNPKPRLFRFTSDMAIINRMGFNNAGKTKFYSNFIKNSKNISIPLGINIGKNTKTTSNISDYIDLLQHFYSLPDYITINISSPNTPNLRKIQRKDILEDFLKRIDTKCSSLERKFNKKTPIFLKIAPDLSDTELQDICDLILKYAIDALIVSNSTISRNNITSNEPGGLSGKPLFELSNQVLKDVYKYTKGSIPLIGLGGINSSEDAYTKICLGASLLQIYSGLIFQGFGLVSDINKGLVTLLEQDGFKDISEAVGSKS